MSTYTDARIEADLASPSRGLRRAAAHLLPFTPQEREEIVAAAHRRMNATPGRYSEAVEEEAAAFRRAS